MVLSSLRFHEHVKKKSEKTSVLTFYSNFPEIGKQTLETLQTLKSGRWWKHEKPQIRNKP